MNRRRHILRWFWAWNDDKEELWLEKMAESGWHLVSGPILYTFEQGEPAQVRYRLDYRSQSRGLDEYLNLCRDVGWERVFQFAGWQYFRSIRPDATEIYTDTPSRVAKYQRLVVLGIVLVLTTLAANMNTILGPADKVISVCRWLLLALYLLWGYTFLRLGLHIRRLKRRGTAVQLPHQPPG